jgi:DNA-binding CsgD family transcriptional regulator/tetratricopeptide (TPR) repeat protein
MTSNPGSPSRDLSSPSLVGRDVEMATLRRRLEQSLSGRGGLVLVSGSAGIGKTALVDALAQDARRGGALVLSGQSYDLSSTPPYGPWLELFQQYRATGDLPDLPPFISRHTAFSDARSQDEIFNSLTKFFTDVAAHQPLLIVLEDLHWSDQTSLDLLRFLSRKIQGHEILLVATYRDDEVVRDHPLYRLLPSIIRESDVERIELRSLDRVAIEELVLDRYGSALREAQQVVSYLEARSEGIPLFIDELLRGLEAEDVFNEGRAQDLEMILKRSPVPDLVRQIVYARLESVSDATREALGLAAVLGQVVPLAPWERICGNKAVAESIEHGLQRNILVEMAGTSSVTFRHALVREAIYVGSDLRRRQGMHRRVAEDLITHSSTDSERIAFHLRQANDSRATQWLILAGERAERSYAWMEAIDRYVQALQGLDVVVTDPARKAGILLRIARMFRYVDTEKSLAYSYEGQRAANEAKSESLQAIAQLNIGLLLCHMNRIRDGLIEIRNAVATLELLADEPEMSSTVQTLSLNPVEQEHPLPRARSALAIWSALAGRYRDVIFVADTYKVAGHGHVGLPNPQSGSNTHLIERAEASLTHGYSLAHLGKITEAVAAIEAGNRVQTNVQHPLVGLTLVLVELSAVHFPYRTTHLDERAALAEKLSRLIDSGAEIVPGSGLWATELLDFYSGNWADLYRRGGTKDWNRSDDILFDFSAHIYTRLHWCQGRDDLARQLVSRAFPAGPTTGPGDHVHANMLIVQRIAAEMAMSAGNLQQARAWLQAHDRWLDWNDAIIGRAEGSLLWSRLHWLSENPDRTIDLLDQSMQEASNPEQPLTIAGIHRFKGEIAMRAGELDEARTELEQSLDIANACSIPYEQALSLSFLAELEIEQDVLTDADALQRLSAARAISTQLGAVPLLVRVDQLSKRIRPGRGDRQSVLTAREIEVLRLLAQGKSDKSIAEELFISKHTVMRHVSRILQKLDVDTRTAAATRAVREDLT